MTRTVSRPLAALVAIAALVAALLLGIAQRPALAKQSLAQGSPTPATCTYASGTLRSVTVPPVLVHMQKQYRSWAGQYVTRTVALQAETAGRWHTVAGSAQVSKALYVRRAYVKRWLSTKSTTTLPATTVVGATAYRATVSVRFFKPSTNRKQARRSITRALTLTKYDRGAACPATLGGTTSKPTSTPSSSPTSTPTTPTTPAVTPPPCPTFSGSGSVTPSYSAGAWSGGPYDLTMAYSDGTSDDVQVPAGGTSGYTAANGWNVESGETDTITVSPIVLVFAGHTYDCPAATFTVYGQK